MSKEPADIDDEELDDVDIYALVEELAARVDRLDRTMYFGLRGLVMLIDFLEQAVNPLTEPEDKAKALVKTREIIDTMRASMK